MTTPTFGHGGGGGGGGHGGGGRGFGGRFLGSGGWGGWGGWGDGWLSFYPYPYPDYPWGPPPDASLLPGEPPPLLDEDGSERSPMSFSSELPDTSVLGPVHDPWDTALTAQEHHSALPPHLLEESLHALGDIAKVSEALAMFAGDPYAGQYGGPHPFHDHHFDQHHPHPMHDHRFDHKGFNPQQGSQAPGTPGAPGAPGTPGPMSSWPRWQQVHPGTPYTDYQNWWNQYGKTGGTISGEHDPQFDTDFSPSPFSLRF